MACAPEVQQVSQNPLLLRVFHGVREGTGELLYWNLARLRTSGSCQESCHCSAPR